MTTDHTNDDGSGGSEERDAEARNYGNDETPEAPPAREPGDLVADIMHALSSTPDDHTLGEVKVIGASGPPRYLSTAVAEWCRAQEGQPTEPPPLPAGWHWLPKLQGYAKTLDEEDSDWVRVYLEGEDVVAEVQADENQRIEVPADVLRHLLGLTPPAADVRAAIAIWQREKDRRGWCDFADLDAAIALLTGQGAP